MRTQDEHSIWLDERVEAYVDGSLPAHERTLFEHRVAADPAWRQSIELSTRIRAELHNLDTPPCPDEVVAAAFARVVRQSGRLDRIRDQLFARGTFLRPALALAMILIAALAIVRPWHASGPAETPSAEVEAALADVKWTLAYLDGVGARTGAAIREQVFVEGVVRPIHAGIHMGLHKQDEKAVAN